MDSDTEVMEPEERAIRRQMEETRSALTEKLGTLEQQVVGTVQDATSAVGDTVATVKDSVQDTVDNVKDTVQDAVQTVKDSMNLPRHVERYPWPMLGGSVVVGFLIGRLFTKSATRMNEPAPAFQSAVPTRTNGLQVDTGLGDRYREPRTKLDAPPAKASWLGEMKDKLQPEIDKLKGMALGTTLGVVRDMVVQAVPAQLGPKLREVIDDITEKLGGQALEGSVASHFAPHDESGVERPQGAYR